MKKLISVVKDLFTLGLSIGFLYILFTDIRLFFGVLFIVLFIASSVFAQVKMILYKIDHAKHCDRISDIFQPDFNLAKLDDIAKSIYKYNLFARLLLTVMVVNYQKSQESVPGVVNHKTKMDICLTELDLTLETLNTKTLKDSYKKHSKLYHPDGFQDENDKKLATQRFQIMSECYEKLKIYLKE